MTKNILPTIPLCYFNCCILYFTPFFQSIQDVGKFERHEVADMPENRGKNRYVNVLACKSTLFSHFHSIL